MNTYHRALRVAIAILASALLPSWSLARTDTLDLVDTLRTRDCKQPLSGAHVLDNSAALDAVARDVMEGRKVRDALADAGVRARRTAVIQISGRVDDGALIRTLTKNYCAPITDPALSAIGVARTEERTVLVLLAPIAPPAPEGASAVANDVLQLVNAARAESRRCGRRRFAAVPPLALNAKLDTAALAHARDLAAHGHLSHEGSDDSAPADRVTRAGYAWEAVAENVAAGPTTARETVDGWLSSPGHCANIMGADFTHMGLAYASNDAGVYWVQVFGGAAAR